MSLGILHRLSSSDGIFLRPGTDEKNAKRVIFLSVEGSTEEDYFRHLYSMLRQKYNGDLPFVLHVLKHSNDCHSDPENVFRLLEECALIREDAYLFKDTMQKLSSYFTQERVIEFFKNPDAFSTDEQRKFFGELVKVGINVNYYQWVRQVGGAESEDVFGIVLDRDVKSHKESVLKEIAAKCQERNFRFYLTNPCFDFWLLLHLCDVATNATEAQKRYLLRNKKLSNKHTYVSRIVSGLAGHSKSIRLKTFEKIYFPNIKLACERSSGFAVAFEEVLKSIGSTLPDFIKEIFTQIDDSWNSSIATTNN